MQYKVGICGISGRMGLEIAALLSDGFNFGGDGFELCDGISSSTRLTSVEGIATRTFEEPPRESVHIWLDFSAPEATLQLLEVAQAPVIIGTTGFTETQRKTITKYSTQLPLLLAPNTSPGMQWLQKILRENPIPKDLRPTVVLEEDHHDKKKDKPSGTAQRLLSTLNAHDYGHVQVHSTRAGKIVGNHRVRFIFDLEELTLEHRALDRKVFAHGALVAAARFLKHSKPGLYTLEDL